MRSLKRLGKRPETLISTGRAALRGWACAESEGLQEGKTYNATVQPNGAQDAEFSTGI